MSNQQIEHRVGPDVLEALAKRAGEMAAPVFAIQGWTDIAGGVPSQDDLTERIRRLLDTAQREDIAVLGSGHFEISRETEGGTESLSVSLNLETADKAGLYDEAGADE